MRVLIATSDYPPQFGGMAVYSAAWVHELRNAGCEVRVLVRRPAPAPSATMPPDHHDHAHWTSGPLRDPWHAYRALRQAVSVHHYDFVIAHTWIGWGPALAYLKGRTGIRYAIAAHGAEVLGPAQSPYYRTLMRIAFEGADRVFPVSSFTADHVAALGLSRERIAVIGNGVDTARYRPAPKNPELVAHYGLAGRDVLTTVGGLVDRKGHDIVIRAVALLRNSHPNLRYVICGGWTMNGSREPALRALVRECGVEDHVVFTGFVEDAMLPDHYRLGDLFVMPGREVRNKGWVEGFGISYLEAAACGVPVIATLTGGVRDAVTDANARIVPPEDPQAVASAIASLLDDRAGRANMAAAGVAWASQNTWAARVQQGVHAMEDVLAHA